MALALAELMSFSFLWTVNPNNFPEGTESTLQRDRPQIKLYTSGKDLPKIIHVVMDFFGLHKDIIYVVLEAIMEHIMKNISRRTLVGGISVLETERHDYVMQISKIVRKAVFSASKGSILIEL